MLRSRLAVLVNLLAVLVRLAGMLLRVVSSCLPSAGISPLRCLTSAARFVSTVLLHAPSWTRFVSRRISLCVHMVTRDVTWLRASLRPGRLHHGRLQRLHVSSRWRPAYNVKSFPLLLVYVRLTCNRRRIVDSALHLVRPVLRSRPAGCSRPVA